jgi:hypothetical protein
MLQDMWTSFRVGWECLEDGGKCVILIIPFKMIDFSSSLFMNQLIDLKFEIFGVITGQEFVSLHITDVRVQPERGKSLVTNACEFNNI